MFIDPKIQFPSDAQPEPVANTKTAGNPAGGTAKARGVPPGTGEDTVSLSRAHSDVQALKASLASVPEVRTERVSGLRQQVSQGQYQPSSEKVADSIIKEHTNLNARA